MSQSRLDRLDERIALLRKRLESAERMRDAVKDDPELLDLFDAPSPTNGIANGKAQVQARKGGRKKKEVQAGGVSGGPVAQEYFKKIAAFLESHGNEPYTIQDIAASVKLKATNVIQVTYRTHNPLFEQVPVPGHSTRKKWRLKKEWRGLLTAERTSQLFA